MLSPEYSGQTMSIPLPLTPWLLASSSHQHINYVVQTDPYFIWGQISTSLQYQEMKINCKYMFIICPPNPSSEELTPSDLTTMVAIWHTILQNTPQIAKFMAPTWDPPGSCRPQMGPMLAPWILLSGTFWTNDYLMSLRSIVTNFNEICI